METVEQEAKHEKTTKPETIRAFYAIKLNEEIRGATRHVVEELQKCDWSQYVRWTAVNNLHITLRFLGNVTQQQLATMNSTLTEQLGLFKPFSVAFKEPRLFPHFRKPKVVATMIPHNDMLVQLADVVEQAAVSVGLEPQTRQFKAHLTLGRCNKSFPKRIKIDSMPYSSSLPVNSISLYQSVLSESGPTYIELKTFPLSGS